MYESMINAYYENNAIRNQKNKGKIYQYSMLDEDFQKIKEGQCSNVSYRYDPCYDYNIVTFTDVNTGEAFSRCQFYVGLKEVGGCQ